MAGKILGVGKDRVLFDSNRLSEIKEAITKQDIRDLIKDGAIKAKPIKGTSKSRYRKRFIQKRKGLRQGTGKRKGKRSTKRRGKKVWIKRVRLLRKIISESKGKISLEKYWQLRKEVKAGVIKYKKHLLERIKEK